MYHTLFSLAGEGVSEDRAECAPTFRSVATGESVVGKVFGLWRSEPALLATGLLGLVLGAVTVGVAAVNGSWLMAPEGRLLEAVKFNLALGIYVLTLGLILPFAPFRNEARRRWVRWLVGLTVFTYGVETVQAWRGLDPRFSAVAGPIDQSVGGIFFVAALGIMVLFIILMLPFFGERALRDHAPLRLSLRYAAGAAMLAFGVGIVMSVTGTRMVEQGDLMLIHAGGFHALQALPVVALFLGALGASCRSALRWTHVAGAGWLLFCLGLTTQAFLGLPIGEPSVALAATITGGLLWAGALGRSVRIWARAREGLGVTTPDPAPRAPVSRSADV